MTGRSSISALVWTRVLITSDSSFARIYVRNQKVVTVRIIIINIMDVKYLFSPFSRVELRRVRMGGEATRDIIVSYGRCEQYSQVR
jgi:hypothetical protein